MKKTDQFSGVSANSEKPSAKVSVIVPVTEGWENLAGLYRAYAEVLSRTDRPFEFIFVFDGDYEEAIKELEILQISGEPIRLLTLPRSFGEATALMVGLEQARGEIVLTLSAHFQTAPEGIQVVLSHLDEGFDVVVTRRHPRIDSWINRLQDRSFNFLTRRLTGVQFQDIGCRLRGMWRQVTQEIDLYGDLHRFFPLLAYQRGFRIAEVSIPQHPSDSWPRVYRPGVYLRRLLDILTIFFLLKFTKKPLRFFGLIGTGLFSGGFIVSAVLTIQRIFDVMPLADRPLLIFGALLMVLGVQIGSIGMLGEIIVFTHAKKMKDYTVAQVLQRFSGGCDPIATMAKPAEDIGEGDRRKGVAQGSE